MTTAIHSRPGAGKTTYLRMARLSLRKGEGEGEGLSRFQLRVQFPNPSPQSSPLAQGERRQRPLD
jgi:hypothetical protein